MRWKTNWLYQLIFHDVEQIWELAVRDGEGPYGPGPDYLTVSQFANSYVSPYSKEEKVAQGEGDAPVKLSAGALLKQWRFDALGLRVKVESDTALRGNTPIRGMFYEVGRVDFIISADRKVVDISYIVGPRYGRGRVFSVVGQGKSGHLVPQEGSVWWVS
ncbi:hypothetical protein IAD21_02156 [Abditibacteriota bacterium]|nr:hypothetical protein IAD21_02156 [Abditibacteriota bacterium]